MHAQNIDEVIDQLGTIIEECLTENSKLVFFPILYRKVTIAVKLGIEKKEFDDNERMEKLDVVFANRYLEAYHQYKAGEKPTDSWQMAFDQAYAFWPIVLQHLLAGINAHINLDLGIAAAEIAGPNLESLKADFYKINSLLSSMVEGVQQEIGRISPVIGILDMLTGKLDERLVDFSIQIARDGAWEFANEYHQAEASQKPELISKRDHSIAWLGKDIMKPGLILRVIAGFIKIFERKTVQKIAKALEG